MFSFEQLYEIDLLNRFRLAVRMKDSMKKRAEFDFLFLRAAQTGNDGQKMLYMALKEIYEPDGVAPELPSLSVQRIGGFVCKKCNKSFRTQAALSGHGPERCKGVK